VNATYKQQIFEYKQKIEMAAGTDAQIKQKFEANQEGFKLLGKSRAELGSSIPVNAAAAQASENEAVKAIKNALDQID